MIEFWQTHLPQVVSTVAEIIGPEYDDVVFAAGSTIEGLANRFSDIDVYYVADDRVEGVETSGRRNERTGTIAYIDGRELNLAAISPAGLAELGSNFRQCMSSLQSPTGIIQLVTENDLKILHRIRMGRALRRPDRLEALQEDLQSTGLPAYLANSTGIAAVNRFTDAEGEKADGHLESASWMLREALIHVGQFALAISGETNSSTKWLARLLRRQAEMSPLCSLTSSLLFATGAELLASQEMVKATLKETVESSGEMTGPFLRRIAIATL